MRAADARPALQAFHNIFQHGFGSSAYSRVPSGWLGAALWRAVWGSRRSWKRREPYARRAGSEARPGAS